MKKFIYFVLLFLLVIPLTNVKALSVSKNSIVLGKNNNEYVELYVDSNDKIEGVDFTLVYSNDDITAEFITNSEYQDSNPSGIKHSIAFGKELSGKITLGTINIKSNNNIGAGNISIYNASGINKEERSVLDNQIISVKVSEDVVKKNLLTKIESKLVKIDLKENVYEYSVNLNDDVKELDLKPIVSDNNVEVNIGSQKISDLKDNQIIIKAKLNDYEEEYKINIKVNKVVKEIDIDSDKFVEDSSYKNKWIFISIVLCVVFLINLIVLKRSK